NTDNVNQLARLDVRNLRTVQGISGVKGAFPLVIAGVASNCDNGTSGTITLLGADEHHMEAMLSQEKINKGTLADLRPDGAISAEFFEQKNLGGNTEPGTSLEINGKHAFFAMQTKGFRGFGSAYCLTTIERARYFSNQSSN